jgi:hypothetical protein
VEENQKVCKYLDKKCTTIIGGGLCLPETCADYVPLDEGVKEKIPTTNIPITKAAKSSVDKLASLVQAIVEVRKDKGICHMISPSEAGASLLLHNKLFSLIGRMVYVGAYDDIYDIRGGQTRIYVDDTEDNNLE